MTGPGIPTIDVQEAARRTDGRADGSSGEDTKADGALLVDVREADEFATVRTDRALHVPMSGFLQRAAELPRDRPILVLCASGNRSAAVTGYLLRAGWSDVSNIDGGIQAWERAGLPVRRGPPAPGEGSAPGD